MENVELMQPDLLTDEENPFFEYNKASQGQRFLNFLIDNVAIRIALAYVTGLAAGYVLMSFFQNLHTAFPIIKPGFI